jgi:hypothetical protein
VGFPVPTAPTIHSAPTPVHPAFGTRPIFRGKILERSRRQRTERLPEGKGWVGTDKSEHDRSFESV